MDDAYPASRRERVELGDVFAGKIAIVTGGASGIGRALCEELGRRRARVVVVDLDGARAEEVARDLDQHGVSASAAGLDVAEAASVAALLEDSLKKYGRIDYMFNNAGVSWSGNFQDMSLESLRRVISVNFHGVLHGTWTAYRIMIHQGFGHIVNTASMEGLLPQPGQAACAAANHAIVGLSTSLTHEARSFGVAVSVICPKNVRTGLRENSEAILGHRNPPDELPPSTATVAAPDCARAILRGVSNNEPIITIGSSAGFAAHRQGCFLYSGLPV